MIQRICSGLEVLRARRPLVHNITNYVVMNFTANVLLALGASPVMAHAVEEVEEMVALSSSLVVNIGTLSTPWIESMLEAARFASKRGIPLVLDPVGAGATQLRTTTARTLLTEARVTVVRGNPSEILPWRGRRRKPREWIPGRTPGEHAGRPHSWLKNMKRWLPSPEPRTSSPTGERPWKCETVIPCCKR